MSAKTPVRQVRMRVVADGPLGLCFHTLETAGRGFGAIVTDKLIARVAEAEGCEPSQIDLVTVHNDDTGAQMWPREDTPAPPPPDSAAGIIRSLERLGVDATDVAALRAAFAVEDPSAPTQA